MAERNLMTVETVQVTYDLVDPDDAALAAKMNGFLTSLGLENNGERVTHDGMSVEFSAYDVSTPFEELAEMVEKKFPGFDTEIEDDYDDGSLSGAPHFTHTLLIHPTVFA